MAWETPVQMWGEKGWQNVVQNVRLALVNKDKRAASVSQFISNTMAKLEINT